MPSTANFTPYDAVAVSATSTYYSTPTSLKLLRHAAYTLHWTGTPTGTFTVWASNKPSPSLTDDTDWVNLSLARAITQPAGTASKDYVDVSDDPFLWSRLKYVNASGSGTITSYFTGKGF